MSERELVRRLRKNDKESFDELFELYYESCYTYAAALLKDTAAREDVLQNVFFKLWCARRRLDPSRPLRNYLMRSIRNEAISFLRLKFNTSRSPDVPDVPDESQDVLGWLQFAETDAKLKAIVNNMPDQRRLVFELSRREGLSTKEIAERLGLSPRTVERHISMALKDLRNLS